MKRKLAVLVMSIILILITNIPAYADGPTYWKCAGLVCKYRSMHGATKWAFSGVQIANTLGAPVWGHWVPSNSAW